MRRRNRVITIAAMLLMMLSLAAISGGVGLAGESVGESAETPLEMDVSALNAVLADAYRAQRYNAEWASQFVSFRFGQTKTMHHTNATLYYPLPGKPNGRTVSDAALEFGRAAGGDGAIDVGSLKDRLNDILNALHDTEKATDVPLVDFDELYGTRFLTTILVSAGEGQPMWSLPEEGFAPIAYAVRPFFFRDAPDSILEEAIYLFVYIVTEQADVGWLIADRAVVDAVLFACGEDARTWAVWPGETRQVAAHAAPPVGRVTITHGEAVRLRAGGGVDCEIVATALPGQSFECVGQTDTGWYVILLEDGTAACISPDMARFTSSI